MSNIFVIYFKSSLIFPPWVCALKIKTNLSFLTLFCKSFRQQTVINVAERKSNLLGLVWSWRHDDHSRMSQQHLGHLSRDQVPPLISLRQSAYILPRKIAQHKKRFCIELHKILNDFQLPAIGRGSSRNQYFFRYRTSQNSSSVSIRIVQ